jgi:fucose permease
LAAALFFLAGWVRPGTEPWFLFGIGLCLSMALGNLAGAGRRESISWGVLAVGFVCGPFFPTLVGIVLTRFSEDAGTAVGTLLGLGSLGNLVLTPLLRWHDASPTAQRGLIMPLLLSLLVALAAMVLGVAS